MSQDNNNNKVQKSIGESMRLLAQKATGQVIKIKNKKGRMKVIKSDSKMSISEQQLSSPFKAYSYFEDQAEEDNSIPEEEDDDSEDNSETPIPNSQELPGIQRIEGADFQQPQPQPQPQRESLKSMKDKLEAKITECQHLYFVNSAANIDNTQVVKDTVEAESMLKSIIYKENRVKRELRLQENKKKEKVLLQETKVKLQKKVKQDRTQQMRGYLKDVSSIVKERVETVEMLEEIKQPNTAVKKVIAFNKVRLNYPDSIAKQILANCEKDERLPDQKDIKFAEIAIKNKTGTQPSRRDFTFKFQKKKTLGRRKNFFKSKERGPAFKPRGEFPKKH